MLYTTLLSANSYKSTRCGGLRSLGGFLIGGAGVSCGSVSSRVMSELGALVEEVKFPNVANFETDSDGDTALSSKNWSIL